MMFYQVCAAVTLLALSVIGQNVPHSCKSPTVVHRLMADDVRFASPFYVLALPRTPKTEQIDNVCYTYFDNGKAPFFHVISVVYKNGSSEYYKFSKSDIPGRQGLAEASADKKSPSPCVYHDHTLTPICNVSVFVLYRCYIEGTCNDIDIGRTSGVDVRVVLAATTKVSDSCRMEIEANLKDTSHLDGGDYIMLPHSQKPKCVTKYNDKVSLHPERAVGSITVMEKDLADRFGEKNEDLVFTGTSTAVPMQHIAHQPLKCGNKNTHPPAEAVNFHGSHQPAQQANFPKKTYADVIKSPPTSGENANVIYHVHRWDSLPPGCCKCN